MRWCGSLRLSQSEWPGHTLKEIARCLLNCLRSLQCPAIHATVQQWQHQDVQMRAGFITMHHSRQQIFSSKPLPGPAHSRSKELFFVQAGMWRQAYQQLNGLDVIAAQFCRVNIRFGHANHRQHLHLGWRVRPSQYAVAARAAGIDMATRATLVLLGAQVVRGGLRQRRGLAPATLR